jgi:hypothetical protein
MYSPKISADLIPKIYRLAKKAGIPMTTWVNRVLEAAVMETEATEISAGRKEENHDPLRP